GPPERLTRPAAFRGSGAARARILLPTCAHSTTIGAPRSAGTAHMNLSPDQQRAMLRQMLTIRSFEERASADYHAGDIYGVVHCYIGEEAVAVGVCAALEPRDQIVSTHRGHGH